jgi:type II secretory pathway component GspD/PulD (secretin)
LTILVYTQLLTTRQGEDIIFQRIFLVLRKNRCYTSFMKRQRRYSIDSIFFSFSFIVGLLAVIQLATPAPVPAGQTEPEPTTVEFFKVGQRPAQELLPRVRTVLSPTGRASADTITNTVIVSDTPESIEKVRQLIQKLDRPVPQVTVTLRYAQAATKSRSLSTSGGISGHQGGLRMSSGTLNRKKNLQLTISSGSSGFLMVGRDVPFTSYWLDLCSRYGYRFGWLTEYKTVSSGFEVRPVVLGERVDLTILPRLSFGNNREIRFTEAATRVVVPRNTWVRLTAENNSMDTVSAAILTANGQTNNRAMILEVMARVR